MRSFKVNVSQKKGRKRQLLILDRGETTPQAIFANQTRHEEVLQVLTATGFGARAGHFEAAEGLPLDKRAGDRAVDVKVAAHQLCLYALDVDRAARIASARQGEFAVVGHFERLIEVLGLADGQDRKS